MLTLSKEFFAVCSTAIKNSAWKRTDFALIESVEKELRLLYEENEKQKNSQLSSPSSQQSQSSELEIAPFSPQVPIRKKTQSKQSISAPSEPSMIDTMIAAGIEQAKRAPMIEAQLLSKVHVDKLPESQLDYEQESL